MDRLKVAAAYAETQYAYGRVRFYLALVLLSALALAFATVAVVYALADDVAEADRAIAGGVVGAVVCPVLAVWMVRSFSTGHRRSVMNGKQWFAALALAALALVGLGAWQISRSNPGAGVPLIGIAVADVALVAALRRRA